MVSKIELTAELKDMVENPDKYPGTPMSHNVLLQSDSNKGEDNDYSYLLKFREKDRDSSTRLTDTLMMDSTKGSPNDRGSNEGMDTFKPKSAFSAVDDDEAN